MEDERMEGNSFCRRHQKCQVRKSVPGLSGPWIKLANKMLGISRVRNN